METSHRDNGADGIAARHANLLGRDRSALLVVDVQEKLLVAMPDREKLTATIRCLVIAARKLGLPILVIEQNPRGLGKTVDGVVDALGDDYRSIEKLAFSCCGDKGASDAIEALGRPCLVVAGVEAHVCILQTAMDLVARGYEVQVPVDGIASRNGEMKEVALRRMQAAGVTLTCKESIVFELLGTAGTSEFRELLPLLKR